MCVKWHRKSLKEFFVKICKSLIQIREKSGVSDSGEILSCQSTETLPGWNCSFKNKVKVSKLKLEKALCISALALAAPYLPLVEITPRNHEITSRNREITSRNRCHFRISDKITLDLATLTTKRKKGALLQVHCQVSQGQGISKFEIKHIKQWYF